MSEKICFGQYKGTEWSELDTSYLEWIVENFKEENSHYKIAHKELTFRGENNLDYEDISSKVLRQIIRRADEILKDRAEAEGKEFESMLKASLNVSMPTI